MPQNEARKTKVWMLLLPGSFFLMLLPVIIAAVLYYQRSAERIYEAGTNGAYTSATQLENYLDTASSMLRVTADTVDYMLAKDVPVEGILDYLTVETANQKEQFDENYTGVYGYIRQTYIDGTGWVPPEDYQVMTRDWYHAGKLARGAVTIATPYLDAQTGSMVVSICKQLHDGESVLAADLITGYMQSVVEQSNINGQGYAFVIGRDGTVIAHRDNSLIGDNLFSRPYGVGLMQRVSGSGNDYFEMTLEGEHCVLFVCDVMEQWNVVLVAEKSGLFTEVYSGLVRIFVLFLCVFLLTAFVISRVWRAREKRAQEAPAQAQAENENARAQADAAQVQTEHIQTPVRTDAVPAQSKALPAQAETAVPKTVPSGETAAEEKTVLESVYESVDGMDLPEARKYMVSDELLENTLRAFYEQIQERADEIEQLSAAGDYENYAIQVHALKSSARMIGAKELSELARVLEGYGNILSEKSE
ncbi:MAG: Hpt domain-containing protein [Lachnospiraceae bacterium]|nr:Hpt domain-containing protein [Lachnospiraceae bacterium]